VLQHGLKISLAEADARHRHVLVDVMLVQRPERQVLVVDGQNIFAPEAPVVSKPLRNVVRIGRGEADRSTPVLMEVLEQPEPRRNFFDELGRKELPPGA
jgi:hypothetical protein